MDAKIIVFLIFPKNKVLKNHLELFLLDFSICALPTIEDIVAEFGGNQKNNEMRIL